MVTLKSCLIRQIISFILNVYGCVYASDRLIKDANFGKITIFSNEAHFDLGEYVNKQKCRISGAESPHAYIEMPTHPQRATVWCRLWSRDIIGPFSTKISKEWPLQSMAIVIGPCQMNS